jgi:hypothetical protein
MTMVSPSSAPDRRIPWYRFSLAELLLLTTVACVQAAAWSANVPWGLLLGWVAIWPMMLLWFWVRCGLLRKGVNPADIGVSQTFEGPFLTVLVLAPVWFALQWLWCWILFLAMFIRLSAQEIPWWSLALSWAVILAPPYIGYLALLRLTVPRWVRRLTEPYPR